jgi:chromate transporter
MMLPSTTLDGRVLGHARRDCARAAFKAGMAPIVIGLLFATGWILTAETPGWRAGLAAGGGRAGLAHPRASARSGAAGAVLGAGWL